jgi:hypothetical protein
VCTQQVDFLPHMFGLFPDRDYCILTVPCHAAATSVLLKNNHFTAAASTPGSTFSHVLYLMHRDR